ncbi:diadenylate cyclase [Desulfopila sp. IMCC35008]|uniref:diadenylate cyclase n=1 Tax=Desulfopila sp. IMCC35008 TaxID=2653858 RepID=UPI0027155A28|nr:diadenylate cyclase [Desulfopila sp. IMCC35008]
MYFLYRTLAKLGTWKIFVGICFAFLVFVLASLLNLEGVEWIFRNISHVAVLAMIVIFQPELRKIFEKIVSLYGRRKLGNQRATSEIIAETLWKLAKVKCGALVVIPGKESITDKISGGYTLNANVSAPIIQSIFDHHSPGHDGAMVLESDRISSFGVRLPISQSGTLGDEYGTRHHAAMGISEQSDAMILLVSEERAAVSMFSNGKMRPMDSPASIVDAINSHNQRIGFLGAVYESGTKIKTIAQIATCLVIATIFWSSLVVVNQQIIEKLITVPVEYTSPNTGLVLVGEKVNEVKVHLTGTKSDLDNLSTFAPRVTVVLNDMSEGERVVLVTKENLKLPKNITILDAVPAALEVVLAEIVQKTVPIVPQLVGKIPEGKKIKNIKIEPDTIQVLAPPDRNGIKTVNASTTPVYLNSIESTSVIYCKIIAQPSMQPVDKKWPDVKVTIELEEYKTQ